MVRSNAEQGTHRASTRCPWQSCEAGMGRCHGLGETARWCICRPRYEAACVNHAGELRKSQENKNGDDFGWFQDGSASHPSGDCHILNPDELGFEFGLAIFKKHGNDLLKVLVEFIERLTLCIGPRESRHRTDKQPGLGASLDHRGKNFHLVLRSLFSRCNHRPERGALQIRWRTAMAGKPQPVSAT